MGLTLCYYHIIYDGHLNDLDFKDIPQFDSWWTNWPYIIIISYFSIPQMSLLIQLQLFLCTHLSKDSAEPNLEGGWARDFDRKGGGRHVWAPGRRLILEDQGLTGWSRLRLPSRPPKQESWHLDAFPKFIFFLFWKG